MPMPTLDPDVYVDAWLSDPAHKLPLHDKGGRLFFALGEKVNRHDQFYAALIADGSLVLEEPAYVATLVAEIEAKAAAEAAAAQKAAEEAAAAKAAAEAPPTVSPADAPATAS